MDRTEFRKTLSESDAYWTAASPAQRVLTPLMQIGLWLRNGDKVGCYMTKAQRRRALMLRDQLATEVERLHALPRLHHSSLAFLEARRLLSDLYERWFPITAEVVPFRRKL